MLRDVQASFASVLDNQGDFDLLPGQQCRLVVCSQEYEGHVIVIANSTFLPLTYALQVSPKLSILHSLSVMELVPSRKSNNRQ